jgi:LPXTG-motif cell wall-anchored protein
VKYADQLCLPSFKNVIPPTVTPEVSNILLLPLAGVVFGGGVLVLLYRRRRRSSEVV